MVSTLIHSLRQMRKSPGFALTVITTLGLTVALSTTVFSVVDAVFLRPLPYHQIDRIFRMQTISPQGYTQPASYPEFVDWRRESAAFAQLAAYNTFTGVNAELNAAAVSLNAVFTSDNFFEIFGVKPLLGRTFERGEEDPGRNNVVVLSHEVWHDLFGSRADAVGAKIKLNGRICKVVGVMPSGFRYPISQIDAVYVPLDMPHELRATRGSHWLQTVARLSGGLPRETAQQRYNAIFVRLGQQYPDTKGRKLHLIDLANWTVGDSRAPLRLLLYAVLALTAIGCVNLAGLLIARGVRLEHEMAIRSALGASRGRMIRQLLSENLVHAIAGGALGVLLAYALLRATSALLIASLARGGEVELNPNVLAASLVVSIFTSLVAGMWPALRISRTAAGDSLRSGNRGGLDRRQNRIRAAFVCVQVSLALVLLVTSGLVFGELSRLQHAEFGFDPGSILATPINLSVANYEHRDVLPTFYAPLLERLHAIPGVRSAGLIQLVPIEGWGWNSDIQIIGQPPPPPNQERLAEIRYITPGFYDVFGIKLVRGRLLDEKLDTPASQPIMVVNERFVERFIPPNLDPIGQAIKRDEGKVVIVGVVRNIRQSIYSPPLAEMDFPVSQIPATNRNQYLASMQLVVRTANRPEAIIPDLRTTFGNIDRTLPFRTPRPMTEIIARAVTFQRMENWLFGCFAALALVLALVGLYGLISQQVEASRRDLGIRIAVGATRARILGLVYRRVGALLIMGVAGGIAGTLAARQLIATVVPIQSARTAVTLTELAAMFTLVSLAAAFLPARRAARVDPIESLRAE